jgi:hypothetical protein
MDHELGQVKNMKLLLNDIEQLPELKLIFMTRVKYFVLEKQNIMSRNV